MMDRREYLLAFYDALGDLPHDVKADVMREYNDYFKTEIEQGKTDEEIIASLGDPVALAYAVRQRKGFGSSHGRSDNTSDFREHRVPTRRRRFGPGRFIAAVITAVVILSAIGFSTAFIRHGNLISINFGPGKKYSVDQSKEVRLGDAKRIEISTSGADAILLTGNSDTVKAALTGNFTSTKANADPFLEITQSGDVLSIAEKRSTLPNLIFNLIGLKLEISIPENFEGEIVFKSASGDFTASDRKFKSLDLKSSSGDIELRNVTLSDGVDLISASGTVSIEGLDAKKAVIATSSGDQELNGLSVSEEARISSTSGDINAENSTCGQLNLSSTSGDTEADHCRAGLISANAVSGNITVNGLQDAANLSSTSGDIEVGLSLQGAGGFILDAQTTSGDIESSLPLDNASREKRKLSGKLGKGDLPLNVETTSGDISIR